MLLQATLSSFDSQAREIDASLSLQGEAVGAAYLDPDKLAWAVATLVGNALRYVRRGSRNRPGGTITVRFFAEQETLVVTVADDGPGIPEAALDTLFVPRASGRHAAGLGLILVRDVVVAHGGDVDVRCQYEAFASGTTVTLRIPLCGEGDRPG